MQTKEVDKVNKSAARTIDVLTLLAASPKSLTLSEICRAIDMPKTSAFELLSTLVNKGVIEFDNADLKTYKPGIKIFEIGMSFLKKIDLTKEARPYLEELTKSVGETVFLAVKDAADIVYVDRVESRSSIAATTMVGTRKPMYCTGLGKAILAGYTDKQVEEIMETVSMVQYTPYTLTTVNALLQELAKIRESGYAIDYREGEMDTACVAAPIYDRNRQPIAAISIANYFSKMDDQQTAQQLRAAIVDTALKISYRMGFTKRQFYRD